MKAFDGRKRPIRGLWVATASGKFYAQLSVEDEATGEKKNRRVLWVDKDKQPVATVAQAVAEMARLKNQQADGELPVLARTPKFGDFANHYLAWIKKLARGRRLRGQLRRRRDSCRAGGSIWAGENGAGLAGKTVQLRFYFRNARIYAVAAR